MNNSVQTINAAASAIISSQSRVQPTTDQKRRWGSYWNRRRWCFGICKNKKRIRHAVLVPQPVASGTIVPAVVNQVHPTPITHPFIAPPSSPTSILQSDPSSATQSPTKSLSLTSLSANAYSTAGPASIFAIGPYAHEPQLVSPPAFSTYTTEPSTASFTPPPESVQFTTPSSPEVPFARLLTSSLEYGRKNGCYLISPGSAISDSGSSSPFHNKHHITGFHLGENPKLLHLEHYTAYKWGSRLGSGSVTPEVGLGSKLGSGNQTPDGRSSGALTPENIGPALCLDNPIAEVASLANSRTGSKREDITINHRVSFELSGEDVARCFANKGITSTGNLPELDTTKDVMLRDNEHFYRQHRSITLGSIKEFNFDNTGEEFSDKPLCGSEWLANIRVAQENEAAPDSSWAFFPLQP